VAPSRSCPRHLVSGALLASAVITALGGTTAAADPAAFSACPEDHWCRAASCSALPSSLGAGGDCVVDGDCDSGICMHAAQSYCTLPCSYTVRCPDGSLCRDGYCLAVDTPPPNGWPCSAESHCSSGLCWDPSSNGLCVPSCDPATANGFCTRVCDPAGAPCPDGSECVLDSGDGAGTLLCGPLAGDPPATPPSGGCRVSSGSSPGRVPVLVGLLLLGIQRRGGRRAA
jgi:hypothetical protein